ncbi:MAG: hypothetical protein ABS36_09100 [Acidobacteria bacterium SCN 69-37]|nr:MAG: hypothetical protein ABS36_09100 [Acidobacteria bacterium SCN 69-37]
MDAPPTRRTDAPIGTDTDLLSACHPPDDVDGMAPCTSVETAPAYADDRAPDNRISIALIE